MARMWFAVLILGGCAPEHPRPSTGACASDNHCPLGSSCDPWSRRCVAADAHAMAGAFAEVAEDAGAPDAGAPDPGPPPACAIDGTPCDDGNPCTSGDACKAGACAGTAYSCDDAIACTLDACDGQGGCAWAMKAGACLIDGVCHAQGELRPATVCQACLPSINLHAWTVSDALACDDANECTVGDHCAAGECLSTPKVCDDGNTCTLNNCSSTTGCVFDPDPECD